MSIEKKHLGRTKTLRLRIKVKNNELEVIFNKLRLEHKYCCLKCQSLLEENIKIFKEIGLNHVKYAYYIEQKAYKKYKKNTCEKCGIDYNLQVHHIDNNSNNNSLNNLMTLCGNCHCGVHKK